MFFQHILGKTETEEKCTSCWRCIVWPSSKLKNRNLLCFFTILVSLAIVILILYPAFTIEILSYLITIKQYKKEVICSFDFNSTTKGPIYADTETVPSFDDLEQAMSSKLLPGGHYIPPSCKSKYKVGIIVPFRDREVHLKLFLRHMHPFLQRQNLEYGIIVVEQARNLRKKNKIKVMSAGTFVQRLGRYPNNGFCLHSKVTKHGKSFKVTALTVAGGILLIDHVNPLKQEAEADSLFNRAILFNIGFTESIKLHSYDCFVFHDVDLLPLDDRNYYSCGDQPVHLSASIDAHNYKLLYHTLFGGASMMTREMVEKVNGFSNVYFGWGGEDDDMSYRIRSRAMLIERYASHVAKYTMMKHAKENKQDRKRLFATLKHRMQVDGLNSLKFKLLGKELRPLYTWIYVRINQTEILRGQNITS